MIPARDPDEFRLLPAADRAFVKSWIAFTDDNQRFLRNTVPIASLSAASLGAVDGTAAMDGDSGFVFLFNPNMRAWDASFTIDEDIDISNASRACVWTVTALYPLAEVTAPAATWQHGQRVNVTVAPSDVRVIKLSKKTCAGPLERWNMVRQKDALLPLHAPSLYRLMPISPALVPPGFGGGVWKTSFSIPLAIPEQLAARAKAYPIDWTAADRNATWLVPTRLIGSIFIERPSDSWDVGLRINGTPWRVQRAYNSRGLARSKCFLGFYFDGSSLAPFPARHALELSMPKPMPSGSFQGVFWENVE